MEVESRYSGPSIKCHMIVGRGSQDFRFAHDRLRRVGTFNSTALQLRAHGAVTGIFPDEPANSEDPIPRLVADARRGTLVAKSVSEEGAVLEWNVICGGENETVLFNL